MPINTTSNKPKICVFDLESDGLMDTISNIWCLWVMCPTTRKCKGWRPHEIDKAVAFLEGCDIVVGHNILSFDIEAIKKFYPTFKCPNVFDTLTLSRMVDPARLQHGLKSYGKELDNLKGNYGEKEEAWEVFTEEMHEYCRQDTDLNVDVYHTLCAAANFDPENPPAMEYNNDNNEKSL
jgi:hypothetical protein